MELQKNKALLSDLIVIAKADDKITEPEYDFLFRLAERMQLTREDVIILIESPIPSQPLFSEIERITHFHRLVLMMNVDMEAHEKEVATLRNFGLKMGIRPGAIDQILHKMNQYDDKVIPPKDLIDIFQTYYN